MASAVATTSRQVGIALGVAVLGTIVGAGLGSQITPAFARATHPGWWIVAAVGVIVAALGWLSTTRRAYASARRTAERLSEQGA